MTKSIHTLIPDVYELLQRKDGWFNDDVKKTLADAVASRLAGQFEEQKGGTLRLSRMGPWCPKALWASVHAPTETEPLPPWAEFKYTYGHLIEALAITLAKASGHKVEGEQDAIIVDGVWGHRDCIIDGCIVDVKSAASRSFLKFKSRKTSEDDPFSYLDQINAYVVGSREDPLLVNKDVGFLWVIDKQLGHMVLYDHHVNEARIRGRVQEAKSICSLPTPPACTCKSVSIGESGNLCLDTQASYNPYKYFCKPFIRTFLYAGGPEYLTKVVREPDVPEVNKYGQIIAKW